MSGFSVLSSTGSLKVAGIVGPAGAAGSGGGGSGFPAGFSLDTEDVLEPLTVFPTLGQRLPNDVFTFTTTGNIDDLDFGNAPLIRANNASLSTIRGLKAGYPGQIVIIESIGAGHVNLADQNANSSANNRLILRVTSAATPLAAGKGSATFIYDGTTLRWRLIAHNQGARITATFNAANFTGNASMTWTVDSGDVYSMSYYLQDNTLNVLFDFDTTTIGGTLSSSVNILNSAYGDFVTSVSQVITIAVVTQAGATTNGFVFIGTVNSLTTSFKIAKDFDGNNYVASTNTTRIGSSFSFPVD